MTSFLQSVRETIRRHQMLTGRERVLVGVSGGADSTALALVLQDLGYEISIAHVNHQLRGSESEEDEKFVSCLAAELKVPFFTRRVTLTTERGNLEAAGREARKDFFQYLVRTHHLSNIAIAHNREDRVETFLLNLMRGSGSEGLVSMPAVSGNVIRPLVETARTEIEGYLRERGHSWQTDRTNADMSFTRNRMRHEIIPRLASLFNARLVEALSRTVVILEDEDRWMRDLAKTWLSDHSERGMDAATLQDAPPALVRRLIREGLREIGSDLHDLTFDHVESVRSLLETGKSGKTIPLPGGILAAREFDRLVFMAEPQDTPDFQYLLPIPGAVKIAELGCVVSAQCLPRLPENQSPRADHVFVDGDRLGPCVKIRPWKPGDYYKPAGWPGGKVKKLFQKARIPRSQRRRLPVFETDSTIIWVTSFPVSREFAPNSCSEKIVAFETQGS